MGEEVVVSAMHSALQGLFNPAVQGFLSDAMSYDPAALAARIPGPLMIVQGGRDLQVPTANGEALRSARPTAKYVVVPAMNHVLKDIAEDSPQANLAAYANSALPVSPALVDAVSEFVSESAEEAS